MSKSVIEDPAISKVLTIKQQNDDEHDRSLLIIQYLRPYLVKLTLHLILIYLSIRAFLEFQSSKSSYETFLQSFQNKVVVDYQMIDYSEKCPTNYEEVKSSFFPPIGNGCRCDFNIYPESVCKRLKDSDNETEKVLKKNKCTEQDKFVADNLDELPEEIRNNYDKFNPNKQKFDPDNVQNFIPNNPPLGTGNNSPSPGTANNNPPPGTGNNSPSPDTANNNPPPGTGNNSPSPVNGNNNPSPGTGNNNPPAGTVNNNPAPGTGNNNPAGGNGNNSPARGAGRLNINKHINGANTKFSYKNTHNDYRFLKGEDDRNNDYNLDLESN